MRKDAKYIYPELEAMIARGRKRHKDIAKAVGIEVHAWCHRRSGLTDWRLGEMLAVRELLAPDMTLDELFRREEVRHDGAV